jgi:hypothetical protein
MSDNSSRWEPGRDAVHRLIQFLDAMAIAFNRFRQRSFYLPIHRPPQPFDTAGWQAGVAQLRAEFDAIRYAIFPVREFAPAYRAARLADQAVAEFARAGARDDEAAQVVKDAAFWLGVVGTPWDVGTPRPWDYGTHDPDNPDGRRATKGREELFDREAALLGRYTAVRRGLLAALARTGRTAPDAIDRRAALAFHTWPREGSDPVPQASLLAMVRATERSSDDTEPPTRLPQPARGAGPSPAAAVPAGTEDSINGLRLQCYPPVGLGELRPKRPEPLAHLVAAAMRDLPVALQESRFGGPVAHLPENPSDCHIEYPAWLAYAQELGHRQAAAEWAVYRHAEAGRLGVVRPTIYEHMTSEAFAGRLEEVAKRYRGGREATVTDWDLCEGGKIYDLRSTPGLWTWSDSQQRGAVTNSRGGAKPDTDGCVSPDGCGTATDPDLAAENGTPGMDQPTDGRLEQASPGNVQQRDPASPTAPAGGSHEAARHARYLELHALATAPQLNRVPLATLDEYQRLQAHFGVFTVDTVRVGPPSPTRVSNSDPFEIPIAFRFPVQDHWRVPARPRNCRPNSSRTSRRGSAVCTSSVTPKRSCGSAGKPAWKPSACTARDATASPGPLCHPSRRHPTNEGTNL